MPRCSIPSTRQSLFYPHYHYILMPMHDPIQAQLLKEVTSHKAGLSAFVLFDQRVYTASHDNTIGVWSLPVPQPYLCS